MENSFRARLFKEERELRQRIQSLQKFILGQEYEGLPEVDRNDLKEQLGHMLKYQTVLLRRVSRQCGAA